MSPIILATVAIAIIVILIYFGGIYSGMWRGPLALFEREYGDSGEFQEAVEIDDDPVTGTIYGPETLEESLMRIRATTPHLLRDDWYANTRADFLEWVHDMRMERLRERVNMAYAT